MTKKKRSLSAGRRPGLAECLEGWWRVADTPAGNILPSKWHGRRDDSFRPYDPFDLYCWQLVGQALAACKTRGVPPSRLAKLAAHIQCGGKFSNFQVHDVIQLDPSDPRGFRSMDRPITELDRIGVDDAWLARAAYAKFRAVLQVLIDKEEPFADLDA